MENIIPFAVAIVVSLIFSTIVAVVITGPLRTILRQLCMDGHGSAFWVSFTNVMLYITPLFFTVLSANIWCPVLASTLKSALTASLFGGFAALLVVGIQISRARPAR